MEMLCTVSKTLATLDLGLSSCMPHFNPNGANQFLYDNDDCDPQTLLPQPFADHLYSALGMMAIMQTNILMTHIVGLKPSPRIAASLMSLSFSAGLMAHNVNHLNPGSDGYHHSCPILGNTVSPSCLIMIDPFPLVNSHHAQSDATLDLNVMLTLVPFSAGHTSTWHNL